MCKRKIFALFISRGFNPSCNSDIVVLNIELVPEMCPFFTSHYIVLCYVFRTPPSQSETLVCASDAEQ